MIIGIPKEIKDRENRVAATPDGVQLLTRAGHTVLVEKHAGMGSAFNDQEYIQAGAVIVDVTQAWDAELVVKVKEPEAPEYQYFHGQKVFTFFHLAGAPKCLTEALLKSKTIAIAYETLEDEQGNLPVLAPMSAVAGNMATLMGSYYLAKFNQGKGMQLGKVLGKSYGKVVVIGDGVVGQHAVQVADGMGANVFLAGLNEKKFRNSFPNESTSVSFVQSNQKNVSQLIVDADLVIGAVLRKGEKAPFVVTEDMIKQMSPGSVIVDVSIDQGGCVETSKPTTLSDPVFIKHDVIHYCVTNMPGAYPRTSTIALTHVTLPLLSQLADGGIRNFLRDKGLAKAVNTFSGYITCEPVAASHNMREKYMPINKLLNIEQNM